MFPWTSLFDCHVSWPDTKVLFEKWWLLCFSLEPCPFERWIGSSRKLPKRHQVMVWFFLLMFTPISGEKTISFMICHFDFSTCAVVILRIRDTPFTRRPQKIPHDEVCAWQLVLDSDHWAWSLEHGPWMNVDKVRINLTVYFIHWNKSSRRGLNKFWITHFLTSDPITSWHSGTSRKNWVDVKIITKRSVPNIFTKWWSSSGTSHGEKDQNP